MRYLRLVSTGNITIYFAGRCNAIGTQDIYSVVQDMSANLSLKNNQLHGYCAEIFDAERR